MIICLEATQLWPAMPNPRATGEIKNPGNACMGEAQPSWMECKYLS